MQKKEIPYCFQRQIYKRMGIGIVFLIICFVMFFNVRNEKLFMSAVLVGTILLCDIFYLYFRAIKGKYLRLQGPCIKTESSGVKQQIKYIYMKIEQGTLRIPAREVISDILPGDMITVYMALSTPVYQQGDIYLVNNYYVMDHSKISQDSKSKFNKNVD